MLQTYTKIQICKVIIAIKKSILKRAASYRVSPLDIILIYKVIKAVAVKRAVITRV